jgi:prolipoprotein diacylglyceryltransferase
VPWDIWSQGNAGIIIITFILFIYGARIVSVVFADFDTISCECRAIRGHPKFVTFNLL